MENDMKHSVQWIDECGKMPLATDNHRHCFLKKKKKKKKKKETLVCFKYRTNYL
jgi:hypothetical protein